jgi:hypothetical protein
MTDTTVVSPFSAESLRAAVDTWMAEIPEDHVAATIEYQHLDGTVRVAAAARVGEHWRVDGSLAWALRTGRVDRATLRVRGSWA